MTSAAPLIATVRIAAAPEEIFPYFTDPELMVRWIGDFADLEPKPGGHFTLDINATPVRGEYVRVDPPHRVVFTWGVPGNDGLPPGSTTVDVTLTPDGADTIVRLVHTDLPTDAVTGHRQGWTEKLERLEAVAGPPARRARWVHGREAASDG